MTQFYSRIDTEFHGDVYSIPFSYIKEEEIEVYLDDILYEDWEFLNESQIEIKNLSPDLSKQTIVSIRRNTDISEKIVEYTNNTLLNKENLNLSQDQLLYAVQEIYDNNTQFNIDLNASVDEKMAILNAEVDEKVEKVTEAVEQLHVLDEAVINAVNAAETATEQKVIATEQANIAKEQTELVASTANKALEDIDTLKTNTINELDTLTGESIETISNLANEIKDNSEQIINRLGLNLGDIVQKDHILSFEESEGLALLGTYVYKEAVAGSRYGYPDFYNKCLEEYQNASNGKQWIKSNVNYVGSVVDNQGVLSGFSDSNYINTPQAMPTANKWECRCKLKFTNTATTQYFINTAGSSGSYGCLVGFRQTGIFGVWLSSNGTSWNIATDQDGTFKPNADEFYFIKIGFTGEEYYLEYSLTGEEGSYIRDITVVSTTPVYQSSKPLCIGNGFTSNPALYTTVDLNETCIDINGERWWTGADTITQNPNGHLFYDIANKEAIDKIFTERGEAWFFGVDEENERIFLPRRTRTQATLDTSKVNDYVEAGLPNITGNLNGFGSWGASASGAFTTSYVSGNFHKGGTEAGSYNSSFDASRSSSVYGKSNTVQPSCSLVLEYMVVGNVTVDKAQTEVTEITTSENDTLPWGYNVYSGEFLEPAVGYVQSLGQWNSGVDWKSFYNKAVVKIGQKFAGGYIRNHTESYDDYDLVINQDDITFRLPLLNGDEDLISNKYVNYTFTAYGQKIIAPANGWLMISKGAGSANTYIQINNNTQNFKELGVQPSASGSVRLNCKALAGDELEILGNATGSTWELRFIYAQGNGNLYFKVANAVENLELLDVGKVMNEAVLKSSLGEVKVVTETYRNGWSWYRVWSDGWCEQGGYYDVGGHTVGTVSLLKPYKHSDYSLICVPAGEIGNTATIAYKNFGTNLTNSTFQVQDWMAFRWVAKGYIR